MGAIVDGLGYLQRAAHERGEVRERDSDAVGDVAAPRIEPVLRVQPQRRQHTQPHADLTAVALDLDLAILSLPVEHGLEVGERRSPRRERRREHERIAAAEQPRGVVRVAVRDAAEPAAHAQPAGAARLEIVELIVAADAAAAEQRVVAALRLEQLEVQEIDERPVLDHAVALVARLAVVAAFQEFPELEIHAPQPAIRELGQRLRLGRPRIQDPARRALACGDQEAHAAEVGAGLDLGAAGME